MISQNYFKKIEPYPFTLQIVKLYYSKRQLCKKKLQINLTENIKILKVIKSFVNESWYSIAENLKYYIYSIIYVITKLQCIQCNTHRRNQCFLVSQKVTPHTQKYLPEHPTHFHNTYKHLHIHPHKNTYTYITN